MRFVQSCVRVSRNCRNIWLSPLANRAPKLSQALEVRDEGIGFDVGKAKANGGIGLISMAERVNLLHGVLVIESHEHDGTSVRASIPLQRSATIELTLNNAIARTKNREF